MFFGVFVKYNNIIYIVFNKIKSNKNFIYQMLKLYKNILKTKWQKLLLISAIIFVFIYASKYSLVHITLL